MGGEVAAHGESEIGGRKMEDRIRPWFFVIFMVSLFAPLPSSAEDSRKMELVLTYEAFYAR